MQAIKPNLYKCAKAGTLACPGKCAAGRLAHQQQIRRIALAPHHTPQRQTNFEYWRSKCWAPEAAPLVAIVATVLGVGAYFSTKAAFAYDVVWKHHSNPYPWLNVPTSAPHLEDTPAYSEPEIDRSYHGERVLQRKSFKTPRYPREEHHGDQ